MKINVGSQNKLKVATVLETVQLYPNIFPNPLVQGTDIELEEFGHPKDTAATVNGAVARAQTAFQNCDYSFGLEGGLIPIPETQTGYMEFSACAIYDGQNIYIGMSAGFEFPPTVVKMILENKADASLAFAQLGLTNEEKLGNMAGGISGFLTQGHLTREDQIRQSIISAMVRLQNPELYQ